jgi:tetratricopeptide (TPR) repeat protein
MTVGEDGGGRADLEIRLLGPVRACLCGRALDLGGVQARSVLAVLLLHPGRVVPRSVIARRAWRGDPPDTAHELISNYISRLRRALAPAAAYVGLEAVHPGFRVKINADAIDAHRFTVLLRQAGRDHEARERELAITHLEQALALWHGHSLALEDVEADWLRRQAVVLQDQRLDALERLASLHHAAGQPERAAALLRDEAPHHPQRDNLISLLVRALAATGQSARAVEVADRAIDELDQAGLPIGPQLRDARRHAQRPVVSGPERPLRQLPPDTGALTGRGQELAELQQLADSVCRDGASGTVVISAIDGMAGVGKTALAVHAGHVLADRFPDGQLFVDLHGFTQGLKPRTAMDVLADVLRTLGVPPQQIPQDPAARAALYRDRLSGRRMLVVLDNAASEQQVRPLLPGRPGCLVLVTSRRRLKALDEASVLSLDVLPLADAMALLRTLAGPGRIPADDPRLEEIAQLCGLLPLALRIAAALLRHRAAWTPAHLADKLRDARPALAGFHDGDRDLSAVFDLSYAALPDDQRLLFHRLGVHPGPDIDRYAPAALLDTDPDTAESLLQHLVDHNLLTESPPGRYRMHDLIRAHARSRTGADPAPECDAALDRLLHYYAHTAQTASVPLARHPRGAPSGPTPAHAPVLLDVDAARDWLRAEYPNLDAAYTHATVHDLHEHAIVLAAALAEILRTEGRWTRALEVHQGAAEIAARQGRPAACAAALTELGRVRRLTGDFPGTVDALTRALELCREAGSDVGRAYVLTELGRVRQVTGDLPGAIHAHTRALEIFRDAGDLDGQANTLVELGRVRGLTGDFPAAAEADTRALEIFRGTGNLNGQAHALIELGTVLDVTGDPAAAADAMARALEIFQRTGDRNGEATALANLGISRRLAGDYSGAVDAHHRAVELFRATGNLVGEAYVLTDLGRVRRLAGDHPAAIATHTRALQIARETGHRVGEAMALVELGIGRRATGDVPGSADALAQALEIIRETGDRGNESWALGQYAATLAADGQRSRALGNFREALAMSRELNHPDSEAFSLEGLADHCLADGDTDEAAAYLDRALEIYERLGMHPDLGRVQSRLAAIKSL